MSDVGQEQPAATTCHRCGKPLVAGDKIWRYKERIYHDACFRELGAPPDPWGRGASTVSEVSSAPRTAAPNTPPAGPPTAGGSAFACALIGALALAIGLFFLFNPSVDMTTTGRLGFEETTRVVNMQRLAIGQTFTIVGGILVGFAIRPR